MKVTGYFIKPVRRIWWANPLPVALLAFVLGCVAGLVIYYMY